jgi:hypothetical protein
MQLIHFNISSEKQILNLITEFRWNFNKAKPDYLVLSTATVFLIYDGYFGLSRRKLFIGKVYCLIDDDIPTGAILLLEY